jgi:cytochrome c5
MTRILAFMLFTSAAHADNGREIWMGTCQACHAEALSGAPLITDRAAWAPRLAKGKEALYRSALNGLVGAKGTEMPARGGNPSLNDEQVKAAVDYMVSKQGESR